MGKNVIFQIDGIEFPVTSDINEADKISNVDENITYKGSPTPKNQKKLRLSKLWWINMAKA